MSEKKWKIEFNPGYWNSISNGKQSAGTGFYEIKFEGHKYGFISGQAWDEQKTEEILAFVEKMLNDAHQLALREHD